MAKSKPKSRRSLAASSTWSREDHSARIDARLASLEKRECRKRRKKRRRARAEAEAEAEAEATAATEPNEHEKNDHGADEDGNDTSSGGDDDGGEELLTSYKRTALARDSSRRIDDGKLRLHITLVRRELSSLRRRLVNWDDVAEEADVKRRAEEERIKLEREELSRRPAKYDVSGRTLKRRKRDGPEKWKLRGAARPAAEVYDFDTRYVDPHVAAHEEARAKSRRIRNVLAAHSGKFGSGEDELGHLLAPHCRRFLGLLMQLGALSEEAGRVRSAAEAYAECVELDDDGDRPITQARGRLMRLYLRHNRPTEARRLYEKLCPADGGAWVRYGAALIEYVSWRLLEEEGSTEETAERMLRRAVECNVFCAYHLVYKKEVFDHAMEYGEELDEGDVDIDAEEGSLMEAIEYCQSEQVGIWEGTDGALEWAREVLAKMNAEQRGVGGFLDWDEKLRGAEDEFRAAEDGDEDGSVEAGENDRGGNGDDNKEDEDEGGTPEEDGEDQSYVGRSSGLVDFLMYAGMFRTAMDMLEEGGFLDRERV